MKSDKNKIQTVKESPLGGEMEILPATDGGNPAFEHRKYDAAKDIKEKGLVPVESVKIVNPITKEQKWVTIRRDGTNIARLVEALANPKFTKERKETAISMFLFEEGKHNASFLMDLWQSKGLHTKETRVFKDQVRKDVDIMVETFVLFMRDASERILNGLHFEIRSVPDPEHKGKEKRVIHRLSKSVQAIEIAEVIETLGDVAFYFSQTADLMTLKMQEERIRREKEIGRGIYVSVDKGIYSIHEDNSEIVTAVERDVKKVKQAKKKKDGTNE